MARCFKCTRCGACDPEPTNPKVKPQGWCMFCGTQNAADAETCAICGKPLPKPAGVRRNG